MLSTHMQKCSKIWKTDSINLTAHNSRKKITNHLVVLNKAEGKFRERTWSKNKTQYCHKCEITPANKRFNKQIKEYLYFQVETSTGFQLFLRDAGAATQQKIRRKIHSALATVGQN